jgi:hypothetical protein
MKIRELIYKDSYSLILSGVVSLSDHRIPQESELRF